MKFVSRLFKLSASVVKKLLQVIAYPVVSVYKSIARRVKKARKNKALLKKDFPGVYVVSNNPLTVKIGRSKHVYRRLKSYRGYQQDGQDIPVLLLLRCRDHRKLEKQLHAYAVQHGLSRFGRTEVFSCKNKARFVSELKEYALNELDHSVAVIPHSQPRA